MADIASMQTKDITDLVMLAALEAVRGINGAPKWSALSGVQRHLSEIPPKLVLSKLRSMIKRRVISGCGCGCRGDFEILPHNS